MVTWGGPGRNYQIKRRCLMKSKRVEKTSKERGLRREMELLVSKVEKKSEGTVKVGSVRWTDYLDRLRRIASEGERCTGRGYCCQRQAGWYFRSRYMKTLAELFTLSSLSTEKFAESLAEHKDEERWDAWEYEMIDVMQTVGRALGYASGDIDSFPN
jgi:hypothetical protein